ncbi:MAG: thiol reductase thioredoxin [Peptococcaceae bacterium]|nr:thiol reductase thioredoxin [Peptococcaceae bacterium]
MEYLEERDIGYDVGVTKVPLTVQSDIFDLKLGDKMSIAPLIDELSNDYAGKAKVCKLNVDDCGRIAQMYGVMSIPTLIVFKGGKETNRIVGFRPKSEIARLLEA